MIPDITYVNLPSPFLEDTFQVYPLGVLQLYTISKKENPNVKFLDLNHSIKMDENIILSVLNAIRAIKSPIIGISAVTPQARFLPLFLSLIGKYLVVGGPHATYCSQDLLDMGFHSVIVGDGESYAKDLYSVRVGYNMGMPEMNLDLLPFLDRSVMIGYKGPAPVMAGRGCPYSCSFCSGGHTKHRLRSPENVVEELLTIEKDDIIFYDDTFTSDFAWVDQLCNLIVNKGIKKNFRCSTRADRLTYGMARLLKKAGFTEVCIGVESGSDHILRTLGKRSTKAQNTEARRICSEVGLKFKAYIMLGSPGETRATIQETEDWLRENRPDSVGLYMFSPLPGSKVWDHEKEFDIQFSKLDLDCVHYGGKRDEMVSRVSTSQLSKQQITQHYWEMLKHWG